MKKYNYNSYPTILEAIFDCNFHQEWNVISVVVISGDIRVFYYIEE